MFYARRDEKMRACYDAMPHTQTQCYAGAMPSYRHAAFHAFCRSFMPFLRHDSAPDFSCLIFRCLPFFRHAIRHWLRRRYFRFFHTIIIIFFSATDFSSRWLPFHYWRRLSRVRAMWAWQVIITPFLPFLSLMPDARLPHALCLTLPSPLWWCRVFAIFQSEHATLSLPLPARCHDFAFWCLMPLAAAYFVAPDFRYRCPSCPLFDLPPAALSFAVAFLRYLLLYFESSLSSLILLFFDARLCAAAHLFFAHFIFCRVDFSPAFADTCRWFYFLSPFTIYAIFACFTRVLICRPPTTIFFFADIDILPCRDMPCLFDDFSLFAKVRLRRARCAQPWWHDVLPDMFILMRVAAMRAAPMSHDYVDYGVARCLMMPFFSFLP